MSHSFEIRQQIAIDVHRMIISLGGYWQPAFGALRILEELAECQEVLNQPEFHPKTLLSELIDLWIICQAVANQYCAKQHQSLEVSAVTRDRLISTILPLVGELARTINAYDGPKKPKAKEKLQTIETLVNQIQQSILGICLNLNLDLFGYLQDQINRLTQRDKNRFASSDDPTTSPLISELWSSIQPINPTTDTMASYIKQEEKIWFGHLNHLSAEDVNQDLTLIKRFIQIAPFENFNKLYLKLDQHLTKEHVVPLIRQCHVFQIRQYQSPFTYLYIEYKNSAALS